MKTNALRAIVLILISCVWMDGHAQSASMQKKVPGIEIIAPALQAHVATLPIQFVVRFNAVLASNSFQALLNNIDVSSKFVVTESNATATLGVQDGVRTTVGKKGKTPAPNSLRIGARSADSRRQVRATRKFFAGPPGAPAAVTGKIPTTGGSVSLPGTASVTFPPGAFAAPQNVDLGIATDIQTAVVFEESAILFGGGIRPSFGVRIRTGSNQPVTDVTVAFQLPESFRLSVPADSEIRVFGQNYWEDPGGEVLDTFELLIPRFFPSNTEAILLVPRSFFTNRRTVGGPFEAVLTLGTTPTRQTATASSVSAAKKGFVQGEAATRHSPDAIVLSAEENPSIAQILFAAVNADVCEGTTLSPPLDGTLDVTSPFGPRDPNIGSSPFHHGVDFRASQGTAVKAMQDGKIEYVNVQRIRDAAGNPTGPVTGWGQYVVIVGPAGRTLYAHLQMGSPTLQPGAPVHAGDVIGLSGNTGTSTGPHLHVEYAPNGSIFVNDNKVNAEPCVGRNVSGSITVRDNGSLADDAFSVAINGQAVCQTQIGAANTCGIGNLRPGTATLTITALIAPDDVGTYEISLGDGLTFSNGTTVRSGTIPEGGSAAFTINIPNQ